MNRSEPPRVARWMLEHLMSADINDALAGDLLENFRAGRSAGWYWRQVFAEIALRALRSYKRHRFVILFAASWAMLSPAWNLILIRLRNNSDFTGFVWRIAWPWSTVCDFGLTTAMNFLFILAGVLIYAISLKSIFAPANLNRFGRSIAMSLGVFIAAIACEIAIALLMRPLLSQSAGHARDVRTLTLVGAIVNFGLWSITSRIPYLIGTVCALWGTVPDTATSATVAQ
jgi:hypothetical protein